MVSAVIQTAASELEGILLGFAEESPDQMQVSDLESQALGLPQSGYWGHQWQGWQQIVGSVQEVGLEVVDAAEMEGFAEDHLSEINKRRRRITFKF